MCGYGDAKPSSKGARARRRTNKQIHLSFRLREENLASGERLMNGEPLIPTGNSVLARRRCFALLLLARLLRRVMRDRKSAALVVTVFLVRLVEGLEESVLLVLIVLISLGLR